MSHFDMPYDMTPFTLIPHDAPQGSDQWLLDRLGKLTGSEAEHVISMTDLIGNGKGKGNEVGREKLLRKLATERLTGVLAPSFDKTAAMQWGNETEPLMREAYGLRVGREVEQVGFLSVEGKPLGVSLDGVVERGADGSIVGILEGKCPSTLVHLYEYLPSLTIPNVHLRQCLHALWVTGADYLDFCSFDPRMPGRLQMSVVRLTSGEATPLLARYVPAALKFLDEAQAEVLRLEGLV